MAFHLSATTFPVTPYVLLQASAFIDSGFVSFTDEYYARLGYVLLQPINIITLHHLSPLVGALYGAYRSF